MERVDQKRIVEALVLAAPEPISSARISQIVPSCDVKDVPELIRELNEEYAKQDRAFEIWEVAGGFQLRTRAEFSGYLQQLHKQRALRLSRAAMETLALCAYRQPVTRAEVEHVRGVDVGAVLKSLMDRHLVRIMGHRDVPGRPLLYGTTRRFLEVFGLESLKALPSLRELDELAREQGLAEGEAEDAEHATLPIEAPEGGAAVNLAELAGAGDAEASAQSASDGAHPAAAEEGEFTSEDVVFEESEDEAHADAADEADADAVDEADEDAADDAEEESSERLD